MKSSTPTRPRARAAFKTVKTAKTLEPAAKPQPAHASAPRTKRSAASPSEPPASTLAEDVGAAASSPLSNVEALAKAGRASYAGIEAVLKRHLDILRDALAELRTTGKMMRHVGVRESIAHLDELAYGAVQLTQTSVRELAALAASTQRDALQVLASRLQDDLAEFRRLRAPQAEARPD